MKLKYLLAGFFLCAALSVHGHPLHLTFTNLEFNTRNNRWTLTIKVFSDDFEADLKKTTGTAATADRNKTSEILKKWLQNSLQIRFDDRTIDIDSWKFEGIKVKEDASWLTYVFTAPLPVSEIKIKNALLLDLYSDQKNLFTAVMGQFQFAHEFKNKDQETVFTLNK